MEVISIIHQKIPCSLCDQGAGVVDPHIPIYEQYQMLCGRIVKLIQAKLESVYDECDVNCSKYPYIPVMMTNIIIFKIVRSLFASHATKIGANNITETATIFAIIAYELYRTALYRLNLISVINPAKGEKTMINVMLTVRGIDTVDVDEKLICMYASML